MIKITRVKIKDKLMYIIQIMTKNNLFYFVNIVHCGNNDIA
jgi:hypothetical protein